jgi:hypothetical protein
MVHGSVSFIFAGDTHVSSVYGICTPRPPLGNGGEWHFNEFQAKLYYGFLKMCDEIENKGRVQAFVTMGDLLDGPNLRQGGRDQWTYDPIDAAFTASELLLPLARMAKITKSIQGSDYHSSPDRTNVNYDEIVAQLIGADPVEHLLMKPHEKIRYLKEHGKSTKELVQMVKNGELGMIDSKKKNDNPLLKELRRKDNIFKRSITDRNNYPRSDIRFKGIYNGAAFLALHDGSYSANTINRGTMPTRNDVIMSLQKDILFPGGYNTIANVYGHAHYCHFTGSATHWNIIVPCWKGRDSFLQKKISPEPDYGIIEVTVETNGKVLIYEHTLKGSDYPVEYPVDMAKTKQ